MWDRDANVETSVDTALLLQHPLLEVDGTVPYQANRDMLTMPDLANRHPATFSEEPVLRARTCTLIRPANAVRLPFAAPFQNSCSDCRDLLLGGKEGSTARRLQRGLLRREKRKHADASQSNHHILTGDERLTRLYEKDQVIKKLRLTVHSLAKKADRAEQRLEAQTARAERMFRSGDFGAALRRLFKATAKGKSDLEGIPAAAANMLNRACKLKGKRSNIKINEGVLMMADLFKVRWGTAAMRTYLANHGGGADITVQRYVNSTLHDAPRFLPTTIPTTFDPTAPVDELVHLRWMSFRRMYAGYMSQAGLPFGTVLMKLAEDETMIMQRPVYVPDGKEDVVWGFCGSNDHISCDPGSHKVGHSDDAAAYIGLIDFMESHQLARCLRAFVAVPQVPGDVLPPMVVGCCLTCLRFTHVRVIMDWDHLTSLCDRHLLDVIGPVVDYASDGASSRTAGQSRLSIASLNVK